jgi:hypothetical protein
MKTLIALTLAAAFSLAASPITLPTEPPGEVGQVFVLQDYRWVPVNVRRTPTAIEASFEVVNGVASVHAELVSERDFRLFSHRQEYEILARTPIGRSGRFQRMIETPGRYRVLIMNERSSPPAAVSLVVHTDVDPPPAALTSGISPRRRFFVILGSLTFFFGTVLWSGRRLIRAYRNR